jgi:hypothetical protein
VVGVRRHVEFGSPRSYPPGGSRQPPSPRVTRPTPRVPSKGTPEGTTPPGGRRDRDGCTRRLPCRRTGARGRPRPPNTPPASPGRPTRRAALSAWSTSGRAPSVRRRTATRSFGRSSSRASGRRLRFRTGRRSGTHRRPRRFGPKFHEALVNASTTTTPTSSWGRTAGPASSAPSRAVRRNASSGPSTCQSRRSVPTRAGRRVEPGHGSGPELRQGTGTETVPASRNRQSLVVPPSTESRHVRPDTGSDGRK